MYGFIAVGLAVQKRAGILNPPADVLHIGTVVGSVLGAVTLLTSERQETLIACFVGIVLVPLVIPWRYVFYQYLKAPRDPWKKQTFSIAPREASSPPQRTAVE